MAYRRAPNLVVGTEEDWDSANDLDTNSWEGGSLAAPARKFTPPVRLPPLRRPNAKATVVRDATGKTKVRFDDPRTKSPSRQDDVAAGRVVAKAMIESYVSASANAPNIVEVCLRFAGTSVVAVEFRAAPGKRFVGADGAFSWWAYTGAMEDLRPWLDTVEIKEVTV